MSGKPKSMAFLGQGWWFPPIPDAEGAIDLAAYEEDVRQAILIVLGTSPGERVMRPSFGAGLNDFNFEPLNTTTLLLVQTRVEQTLIDWEARIDIVSVEVTPGSEERNRLDIAISYRVRATNSLHNLVYPFYLQEGSPQ